VHSKTFWYRASCARIGTIKLLPKAEVHNLGPTHQCIFYFPFLSFFPMVILFPDRSPPAPAPTPAPAAAPNPHPCGRLLPPPQSGTPPAPRPSSRRKKAAPAGQTRRPPGALRRRNSTWGRHCPSAYQRSPAGAPPPGMWLSQSSAMVVLSSRSSKLARISPQCYWKLAGIGAAAAARDSPHGGCGVDGPESSSVGGGKDERF
jgi:hypothetical protein